MAKEFFKKHGVGFTELNVLIDEAARKEMSDKSHQMGVPVIDIDGEFLSDSTVLNWKERLIKIISATSD